MSLPGKQFERGLVVGKFCPLHRGHELLIRHALASCDEVVIISYTKPEFDGCGRAAREAWIRALFPAGTVLVIDDASLPSLCLRRQLPAREIPHNDAPDAVHRDFIGWLCHDVLQVTVDAVFTSEDYGDGFAAALTAFFSARLNAAPIVQHVCVDKARRAIPVSGTAIRSNPHALRAYLSPIVYASFVKRVCFLGGESSGKTTLASALAEHLHTAWAPEYGRELWVEEDGNLCFHHMLQIAHAQVALEERLSEQADTWLFCDTSPLTTLFYSLSLFGDADARLIELGSRHYDAVFLCVPDFAFVQDGTRRDESFRQQQHEWYLGELQKRSIRFISLTGPIDSRINTVIDCLNADAGSADR